MSFIATIKSVNSQDCGKNSQTLVFSFDKLSSDTDSLIHRTNNSNNNSTFNPTGFHSTMKDVVNPMSRLFTYLIHTKFRTTGIQK